MKHPLHWKDLLRLQLNLSVNYQHIEMESIPFMELSSLVEDIHVKTREVSQNTDLDMREFLGIDKALQGIQGELLNDTSKLTEINKHINSYQKVEEVENDPTYSD